MCADTGGKDRFRRIQACVSSRFACHVRSRPVVYTRHSANRVPVGIRRQGILHPLQFWSETMAHGSCIWLQHPCVALPQRIFYVLPLPRHSLFSRLR